ncbi:MAG: SpoIIIAH-like family protein [Acetatifactor sp.]|nr:SpoIIIAH-like family protein [Acetatifactor sp.]
MKNVFKKNQLMITALAIMIAIAGYLQFAENTIKEEPGETLKAVDSGKVITENYVAGDLKKDAQKQEAADTILELSEEDLLLLG